MPNRNSNGCYKQISNGIYKVTGTVRRSPRTGKYIVDDNHMKSPQKPIVETVN